MPEVTGAEGYAQPCSWLLKGLIRSDIHDLLLLLQRGFMGTQMLGPQDKATLYLRSVPAT